MNILHISNYEKKGGAEIVFSISSQNPEQTNLTGYFKIDELSKTADIQFRSWENNNALCGIINYIFSLNNYRVLYNFLKINKVDIIHLQGFFSSLSPSILLAIKKIRSSRNIKVIQTLHEFHLICPNASLYNFTKNTICEKCLGLNYKFKIFTENCDNRGRIYSIIKGIRSFFSNNLLRQKEIVDIFISPSEFLRDKLIDDGVSFSKIKLIRNPTNINCSDNRNEKKNIVCYFGRFSYEKNIPFLISSFSKWKKDYPNDFQLLLIGDGTEKQKILDSLKLSEFSSDITIKPSLPHEKLLEEIKECKYFSITSSCYENSPMSILESVALGIIPIVPDIGGMKESIESIVKVGITFTPNNIDSWVKSIIFLEKNYLTEKNKLDSVIKPLLKELNIAKYYERLNELYLELKDSSIAT